MTMVQEAPLVFIFRAIVRRKVILLDCTVRFAYAELKIWEGLHCLVVVGCAAGGLPHNHQLQESLGRPFDLDEADITMKTEIMRISDSNRASSKRINRNLNVEQCRRGKRV